MFCIVAHRPLEWVCAFIMIGFSAVLSMPGNTFSLPSYAGFVREGLTEQELIYAFGMIGMLRMLSLVMAGSPKSPRIRQIGAFSGGLVFMSVAAAFAEPWVQAGAWMQSAVPITPGASTYAILALFEGMSIRLAGQDRINGY